MIIKVFLDVVDFKWQAIIIFNLDDSKRFNTQLFNDKLNAIKIINEVNSQQYKTLYPVKINVPW